MNIQRAVSSPRYTRHSLGKLLIATVAIVGIAGCSGQPLSTREKGTLLGAGGGAATGAVIGAIAGAPGLGALIGGGLGTVGGFLLGNAEQNREIQQQQTEAQIRQQQQELERQRRELEQLKATQETE